MSVMKLVELCGCGKRTDSETNDDDGDDDGDDGDDGDDDIDDEKFRWHRPVVRSNDSQ